MKRIVALILAALLPAVAAAQPFSFVIRNNSATTTLQNENLRPSPLSATATGELFVTSAPGAGSITKNEDDGHVTGDDGILALSVRNTGFATLADTTLDYAPIATNAFGAVYVVLDQQAQNVATSAIRIEDAAYADGQGLMVMGAQRDDAASVDTGASLDIGPPKMDKFNRLLVTEINQEHLFSCVSAADVTDTNAATLCTADTDELFVVTAACCNNTDTAVGTIVQLQDETGPTVFHIFFLPPYVAAAPGDNNECQTFPSGIKMAAVNKAIQIQNVTTSAQVRCAIQGYKLPS